MLKEAPRWQSKMVKVESLWLFILWLFWKSGQHGVLRTQYFCQQHFLLLELKPGTAKRQHTEGQTSSSGGSSGLFWKALHSRQGQATWISNNNLPETYLGICSHFGHEGPNFWNSALPTSLAAGEPGCHPAETHVSRALTQGAGCQDSPPAFPALAYPQQGQRTPWHLQHI